MCIPQNGVWSHDFPACAQPPPAHAPAPTADGFERDLYEYLHAIRQIGLSPPAQWSPQGHAADWEALDLSWVRRFDYAGSPARLVAAIPGRHTGVSLSKWGHMGVRRLIDAEPLSAAHATAPLLLQFSSLSSPGQNVNWLSELVRSMCGPAPQPSAIHVVYPTQRQIGDSLEGWIAGSSIPCEVKNAIGLKERLCELPTVRGLPRGQMCSWDGGDGGAGGASGRVHAVPHIKSFCRFEPTERTLAWALLGSHNLSQAAWGKLEKNSTQLYIKSYELGVLLLPSLLPPAPASAAHSGGGAGDGTHAPCLCAPRAGDAPPPPGSVVVPLPYSLPPRPYAPGDITWSTNDCGRLPSTQTAERADRHGRMPWSDSSGYYGQTAIGKLLLEQTRMKSATRP